MEEKILYIVATPIGNMSDMSFRALETLKRADVVLCEDTRQTMKILERYEFKVKLTSLHQHSSPEKIKSMLEKYSNVAYVSDAGTPTISDPGGKVVAEAITQGYQVSPIPGPSAVTAALSVSGFPTDKFIFLGFMPHKGKQKVFDQISESKVTVCFYESPHRILKTLDQLVENIDADRQVMVGRELTKKFETLYRGNAAEVLELVKEKVKGEFVVVVSK